MFPFPPRHSSLPKTPGISPSLPLQTSRKLFLSLCLKLQTPASLAASPVPAWSQPGLCVEPTFPTGPWGGQCPQGSHISRTVGLPHPVGPEPGGVPGCQHPAGPTSAVGEPVERVALVAEALEAAGGVDAEVVAGPVKGALVDV